MAIICSICGTDNFRKTRGFDHGFSCQACDIVFCEPCAGRKEMGHGIRGLCCPRCETLDINVLDWPPTPPAACPELCLFCFCPSVFILSPGFRNAPRPPPVLQG